MRQLRVFERSSVPRCLLPTATRRRSSDGGGDLFFVPLDRDGLAQAAKELDALGVATLAA